MNPIAAIFDGLVLYRYSLVLSLAAAAGICFFLACCSYLNIPFPRSCAAVFGCAVLGLPLSRLVYWYARPDSFSSLLQAVFFPGSQYRALSGLMAGCALSALLAGGADLRRKLLDCMSLSGSFAIALGRLGCFFTAADRGQIMTVFTTLPWAYPVTNASGVLQYRFATFLFQAAAAGAMGIGLVPVFRRKQRPGTVTTLFLLFYCASQILLDSTRYDSLSLRNNGFISIVQLLSAITLLLVLAALRRRVRQAQGNSRRLNAISLSLAVLCGAVACWEYYVQRHGSQAFFGYCAMAVCLSAITALGVYLLRLSQKAPHPKAAPV